MSAIISCPSCGVSVDNDRLHMCHPADVANVVDDRLDALESENAGLRERLAALERCVLRALPLTAQNFGVREPD